MSEHVQQAVLALLGQVVDDRLARYAPDEQLGLDITRASRKLLGFDRRYALAMAARAPAVEAEHADAQAKHHLRREYWMRRVYFETLKRGVYGLTQQVAELTQRAQAEARLAEPGDPNPLASLARWAYRQLAKLRAAITPNPWAVAYVLLLLDSVLEWERDQLPADDEEQLLGPAVLAEVERYQEHAAEGLDDGSFDGLPTLPCAPFGLAPEHVGHPAPHAPAYAAAV